MKAVILAAGRSSRFKPLSDNRHKGLIEVFGKPIIEHTVEELREAGINEIIAVQNQEENIKKQLGDKIDHYVVQETPKGMGNALKQAEPLLDGKFLVVTPYRANAAQFFKPMIEKAEKEDAEIVFVSAPTDNPEKYGILDIEQGKAKNIVEKPEQENAPSNQKAIGMYLLSTSFFSYLENTEEWEYQYEDALGKQMNNQPASIIETKGKIASIKYPWDLFSVVEDLADKKSRKISEKATIADSAIIKGNVIIEKDAVVHENAVIKGPAYIGEGSMVGNNALVRDNTSLEKNAEVGANTEVKNSILQPNASIHSGFIGDSIIGRNTKIGAETVVANRRFRDSGERPEIETKLIGKNRSQNSDRTFLGAFIGDNVDIGVNVSIMPGVQIGSNAQIGPGTVVKENVNNNEKIYLEQDVTRK